MKKRPLTAKELLEKIKSLGDIIVRPVEGGRFRAIFGYEKAKEMDRAGIEKIPVAIIDANDEEERFLHMIDVLQDKDVSPLERAMSIERYLEITSLDYETFADRFDLTKDQVSQWLEVLLYPKILVE